MCLLPADIIWRYRCQPG